MRSQLLPKHLISCHDQTLLSFRAKVLMYRTLTLSLHDHQDMNFDCHVYAGLRDAQLDYLLMSHTSFGSHMSSPQIG